MPIEPSPCPVDVDDATTRFSGLSSVVHVGRFVVLRAVLSMIVVAAGLGGYWAVQRLGRFLDEPAAAEPGARLPVAG